VTALLIPGLAALVVLASLVYRASRQDRVADDDHDIYGYPICVAPGREDG
jgi:hypothetical protein